MFIEAEIHSALKSVRPRYVGHVVDVLQSPHAARVVGKVCVRRRGIKERERLVRIGMRSQKLKEVLADPEDEFVRQLGRGRPAPIESPVFRSASCIDKIRIAGEDWAASVCRITKSELMSLSVPDINQIVFAQLVVELRNEVVLSLMLRRPPVESRRVQAISDGEVIWQGLTIDNCRERWVKTNSRRVRSNVVRRDARCICGRRTSAGRQNRVAIGINRRRCRSCGSVCPANYVTKQTSTCLRCVNGARHQRRIISAK